MTLTENRLIAVEENTSIPLQPQGSAAVTRTRLDFSCDAWGRRISKNISTATGNSNFVLQQSLVYLYDGWNMIAEIDTSSSAQLLRSCEWGTDISGTMTGAGGVGGLLIERFHAPATPNSHLPSPGAHAPCYDGNGNVTELVNPVNGGVSARYEYGAFGETISMDGGAVAEANPFRFSTKYLDAETGLYNYGYRYYDAVNGRWPNRDPIGENGGINLYGMVKNDPVNHWDYLGLVTGPFNSLDAAGKAASLEAYKLTESWMATDEGLLWMQKDKGMEYYGYICECSCSAFNYTPPKQGVHPKNIKDSGVGGSTGPIDRAVGDKMCKSQFGKTYKVAGWYHSHPFGPEFSDADALQTNRNNMPGFVGYGNGVFDPGASRIDPNGDPNSQKPFKERKIKVDVSKSLSKCSHSK